MMIEILSSQPIVFGETSELLSTLRDELHIGLKPLISNPFEFRQYDNIVVKETHRRTFEIERLFKNSNLGNLLREFAKENIGNYLAELQNLLTCSDYKINNLENIKFSLRIRVIEDLEGYYLTPHRDSPDTLLAFIMQLSEKNPSTCIYKLNKTYKTKITADVNNDEIKIADQLIKQTHSGVGRQWRTSQFGKNKCCWSSNNLFFKIDKIHDWLYVHEFSQSELMTKNSTIYAIHNTLPKNRIISSSKYEDLNDRYYHGVPPITVNSRKLMLMDLIAKPTDSDVLSLEGIQSDPTCYFIIFSPKMNSFLKDILSRS